MTFCKPVPRAIPKLVYTANHINDCFAAFDLLHETRGDRIVLCMGEAGLISRILAKKLGGLVTFASLSEQTATAPGQLTIGTLKQVYRYASIDARTELFGVVADPVGHSLSPTLHNACFDEKNLNKLYLPLLVQGGEPELSQFLDNILARPWLSFRGLSVTIPHKHNALKYVQEKGGFVAPLVDKIGAANTLLLDPHGEGVNRRLSRLQHRLCRCSRCHYGRHGNRTQGPAGYARGHRRRGRGRARHCRGPDRRRRQGHDLQPHRGTGRGTCHRIRLSIRGAERTAPHGRKACWSTAPASGCTRMSTRLPLPPSTSSRT